MSKREFDDHYLTNKISEHLQKLGLNHNAIVSINGYELKFGGVIRDFLKSGWDQVDTKEQLDKALDTEIKSNEIGAGFLLFLEKTIEEVATPTTSYGVYRISANGKNYVNESREVNTQSDNYQSTIAGKWTVQALAAFIGREVVVPARYFPAKIQKESHNRLVYNERNAKRVDFEILEVLPLKKLVRPDGKYFSKSLVQTYLDYKKSYFMGVYGALERFTGLNEFDPNLKESAWEIGCLNAGHLVSIANYRRVKKSLIPYAHNLIEQKEIFRRYRQLIDHREISPDEVNSIFDDLLSLKNKNPDIIPSNQDLANDIANVSEEIRQNWSTRNQEFATVISALVEQDQLTDTSKENSFKRIKDVVFDNTTKKWNTTLLLAITSHMSDQSLRDFYAQYPQAKEDLEQNDVSNNDDLSFRH